VIVARGSDKHVPCGVIMTPCSNSVVRTNRFVLVPAGTFTF